MLNRLMTSLLLSMSILSVVLLVMSQKTQAAEMPAVNPMSDALQLTGRALMTPSISLEVFATGFNRPTDIAHAGDTRLFVVEKGGLIRIVQSNGTVLTTPFLDITDRVYAPGGDNDERGLLGLAFHPNYAGNGYFYVNYIHNDTPSCQSGSGTDCKTRISRFQVTANANIANPASETILLTVNQDFFNHNGGDLNFGPDGYLYIGLGDGGSQNDPNNQGQDPNALLGKMLRIDVDSGSPYGIPGTNPFTQTAGTRDEIWALGLRNPWRFSFDRQTGDMYIGDVGQGSREEINRQQAGHSGGLNYGWRCYEGNQPFNTSGCGPIGNYTFPIHDYPRSSGNCSVTGGYVYRGSQYPVMQGHYFFADFCSRRLWSLMSDGQGGWQLFTHGTVSAGGSNLSPTTFGENNAGELFVGGFRGGSDAIFRIIENTAPPVNAGISLQKTVTLAPNCASSGTSNLQLTGTAVITEAQVKYCYVVQNTGDVTFTTHSLIDDKLGSLLTNPPITFPPFPPGGTITVTQSAILTTNVTNVAVWEASDGTTTISATASATVTSNLWAGLQRVYLPVILK